MTEKQFYNRWIKAFSSNVASKDIENYVKAPGNYIWHVFSWELLEKDQYLTGSAARKAYDAIDKSDALYTDWFGDQQIKVLTKDLFTADALDHFAEVYVVSDDFQWTYIKTHEPMCGPYFLKIKK